MIYFACFAGCTGLIFTRNGMRRGMLNARRMRPGRSIVYSGGRVPFFFGGRAPGTAFCNRAPAGRSAAIQKQGEWKVAQLFFKYGAMNSGKSSELLQVANNYEEQNKPVMRFTSGVDARDGVGWISSRVGLKRRASPIFDDTDVFDIVRKQAPKPCCVLIDEVQFVKKHHVLQFAKIVDELGIPVMGFGLKNDFRNELFEGSKYMLLYADKIEEMKTI